MVYVMSDIHGNYEKYIQAIKTINLQDDDTLYVLGDVVDRGENPCKILLDMMCRLNVIPLIGNHEDMAISLLSKLIKETQGDSSDSFNQDFIASKLTWCKNGGESTLEEFKKLSLENKQAVLDYLEEFEWYKEVSVNGQDYILVHAGLDKFKRTKKLSDYKLNELIYGRKQIMIKYILKIKSWLLVILPYQQYYLIKMLIKFIKK